MDWVLWGKQGKERGCRAMQAGRAVIVCHTSLQVTLERFCQETVEIGPGDYPAPGREGDGALICIAISSDVLYKRYPCDFL